MLYQMTRFLLSCPMTIGYPDSIASNTFPEREKQVFGGPLETLWKNCIFGLCGVSNVHRKNYEVVIISTLEQRRAWLRDVQEVVHEYFPPATD